MVTGVVGILGDIDERVGVANDTVLVRRIVEIQSTFSGENPIISKRAYMCVHTYLFWSKH